MLTLKIGAETYKVTDYADASRVYCAVRDESMLGGSEFPSGRIGRKACVSYNGKVWEGAPKDWYPGKAPLFNPYSAE